MVDIPDWLPVIGGQYPITFLDFINGRYWSLDTGTTTLFNIIANYTAFAITVTPGTGYLPYIPYNGTPGSTGTGLATGEGSAPPDIAPSTVGRFNQAMNSTGVTVIYRGTPDQLSPPGPHPQANRAGFTAAIDDHHNAGTHLTKLVQLAGEELQAGVQDQILLDVRYQQTLIGPISEYRIGIPVNGYAENQVAFTLKPKGGVAWSANGSFPQAIDTVPPSPSNFGYYIVGAQFDFDNGGSWNGGINLPSNQVGIFAVYPALPDNQLPAASTVNTGGPPGLKTHLPIPLPASFAPTASAPICIYETPLPSP